MKKLMTHLYYGDVSPKFSEDLAMTLVENGADILEIGVPYSDPVSDGPVFQRACCEALKNGITPIDVLKGIKRIRSRTDLPIYLTSYFGPIYKTGIERILNLAKEAKVSGVIIPDLPIEEQENYKEIFKKFQMPIIQFATIYSTMERLEQIINKSKDFIYVVTLPGVTGDKVNGEELGALIKKIKKLTDKKVFCGFGIRSPEDAKKIIDMGADGVIVGSAIAEIYQPTSLKLRGSRELEKDKCLEKIGNLVANIKNAII